MPPNTDADAAGAGARAVVHGTAPTNLAKLEGVFRDVLDLPADTDLGTIRYGGIETWDSLSHMALVGEIEDAFDIMLDTNDVLAMSDFGVAVAIIERLGIELAA
jgi:acyl carrier protein